MKITIVTVFPGIVSSWLSESMFKKASENELVSFQILNLRDFTTDKHRQVDDMPFGGGAGMVMKPEPFFRAYDHIKQESTVAAARVIFPSPQGILFNHSLSCSLAQEPELVFFCGHYKGVDERVIANLITDEISIGDYVLTGGELPALVMIDAIIRHIPGVLNSYESAETDSFADNLLEGPIFTRPQSYRGLDVPEVLVSGNHAKIDTWKMEQRIHRTRQRRSDLLDTNHKDLGG